MKLFLPFTPAGKKIEETAIKVKQHLGLSPYASVDPWQILPAVPARLVDFASLPAAIQNGLVDGGCSEWSAVGFGKSQADGRELILVNPTHHEHRQRASLMEEVVHIILEHPKVPLRFDDTGRRWRRPFERDTEDEAFSVGAACILPYRNLFRRSATNDSAFVELQTDSR